MTTPQAATAPALALKPREMTRRELAAYLSPDGVAYVEGFRRSAPFTPQPVDKGVLNAKIGLFLTAAAGSTEEAERRRDLLSDARRFGGPQARSAYPNETSRVRWDEAIQKDGDNNACADLWLAPLLAGQLDLNAGSNALFRERRNGTLIEEAVHGGWPIKWFEAIADAYDAPLPSLYRAACECNLAMVRFMESEAFYGRWDLTAYRDALAGLRTAAGKWAGETVEWRHFLPAAPPLLDFLIRPMDIIADHKPIEEDLLETLDALLGAGADPCPSGVSEPPLIWAMKNTTEEWAPIAARLVERVPDLHLRTPGFQAAHDEMRAHLIKTNPSIANSVAAAIMKRAAHSTTEALAPRKTRRRAVF